MASVLNRTTKVYIPSANTPDYPVLDWIINPDVSLVAGWPTKYWIITGDVVTLMDSSQRAALDAAELQASYDTTIQEVDDPAALLRSLVRMLVDELNLRTNTTNAIMNAINNGSNLSSVKTAVAAIPALPSRTLAQVRTTLRNQLGS